MTTELKVATRPTVIALLAVDTVLIIIFAILGVSSHNGGLNFTSVARVAIPFLVPYLILAGSIRPTRLIHNLFPTGIALWLVTIILGVILRAAIFNDTSAPAFILVATGVLAAFLLGRRIISTFATRRRQTA